MARGNPFKRLINLSGLKTKLGIINCAPLVLMGFVIAITLWSNRIIDRNLQNTGQVQAPLVKLTGDMQSALGNVQRWIWVAYLNDDNLLERSLPPAKIREEIQKYTKAREEYVKLPLTSKEQEIFKSLDETWSNISPIIEAVVDVYAKTEGKKDAPERVQMNQKLHGAFAAVLSVFEEVNGDFDRISKSRFDDLTSQVDYTLDVSHKASRYNLILSMLGSILCLFMGWMIAQSLIKSFVSVFKEISATSETLKTESEVLADAGKHMSEGALNSAKALQETVTAIEQISAMIAKNAENSNLAADVATKSHQAASQGDSTVQQMMHAMSEIESGNEKIFERVSESNQEIAGLVRLIGEISDKTKVINDIVFQTKLLSFNASVEAARAGEHGKGFAVVAEEVGLLAKNSGDAAREIEKLLTSSTARVQELVRVTESKVKEVLDANKENVVAGSRVVQDCSKILAELVRHTSTISQLAQAVSTATSEQSNGVQEISKAMNVLDELSQKNSATSQEIGKSSEEVADKSGTLDLLSKRLSKVLYGSNSKLANNGTVQAAKATDGPQISETQGERDSNHVAA